MKQPEEAVNTFFRFLFFSGARILWYDFVLHPTTAMLNCTAHEHQRTMDVQNI